MAEYNVIVWLQFVFEECDYVDSLFEFCLPIGRTGSFVVIVQYRVLQFGTPRTQLGYDGLVVITHPYFSLFVMLLVFGRPRILKKLNPKFLFFYISVKKLKLIIEHQKTT